VQHAPALAHALAWVAVEGAAHSPGPSSVGAGVVDGHSHGAAAPSGDARIVVDPLGGARVVDDAAVSDSPAGGNVVAPLPPSRVAAVDVYTCGPSGFPEGVGAALVALGVSPERLHTESFAY
jgi:hypothetical protein